MIESGSAGHFIDGNNTEIFSQHGDQKSPARFTVVGMKLA
jgi:hypothetical protein